MNIKGWFTLELTALISLQSKGPSVFSNTAFEKYQFLGFQLSLWSNSHIHTRLLRMLISPLKPTSDIIADRLWGSFFFFLFQILFI